MEEAGPQIVQLSQDLSGLQGQPRDIKLCLASTWHPVSNLAVAPVAISGCRSKVDSHVAICASGCVEAGGMRRRKRLEQGEVQKRAPRRFCLLVWASERPPAGE